VNDFSFQNCTLGADSLDVSKIDDPQKCKVIFSAKFFFCILENGIVAGKYLLSKRVILVCKECYSHKISLAPSQLIENTEYETTAKL
jgi:hypothetical protein